MEGGKGLGSAEYPRSQVASPNFSIIIRIWDAHFPYTPHHHFSLAFLFLSLDFSCSPSLSGWIFSQLFQSYISEVFNITAYKCPLKIVMFNVSCSSLIPSSKQEISPTLYPELILWLLICDLKKRDVLASKIGNKIYFLFPPAFFSIPNLQKMDKVFIVHRRW